MAGPGVFLQGKSWIRHWGGEQQVSKHWFQVLTVEVEVIYLKHVLTIFTICMLPEGTSKCINSCRFVHFDVFLSDHILPRTSLKIHEVLTRNFVGR